MPQAGNYRITVIDKDTGAFIGVYPVVSDGTEPLESIALESAVIDGKYDDLTEAHEHAVCKIMSSPSH